MKRVVIVLFVISLEILFVVGCSQNRVETQKFTIKKGEKVEIDIQSIFINSASMEKENSLPEGIVFQKGSLVGTSKQDGVLKISFWWNETKNAYDSECVFRDAQVEVLLQKIKREMLKHKTVKTHKDENGTTLRFYEGDVMVSLLIVNEEIVHYYASVLEMGVADAELSSFFEDSFEKIFGLERVLEHLKKF